MTANDFAIEYNITIKNQVRDSNPNFDLPQARHYTCTLLRPAENRQRFTTPYSKGRALQGEPTAAEVLECLAMDVQGVVNARDFKDWASDYGYDLDSRKAEKIYNTIERQKVKLQEFLGADGFQEFLEISD